jgi:hypothetical protein
MASIIDETQEVLHRIRARLYANYLPSVDGEYIARTDDEAALKIPQVCASMKNRGGFTGSVDDAQEHVHLFLKEAMYQICDGFSVDFGFFKINPRIGGAFKDALETWDPKKHPVKFSFHVLKPLRDIVPHIEVYIEGVHDGGGFIAECTDITTEAVNETLTPGGMFALAGHKIKVAGEDAACGVYFAPEGAGAGAGPAQKVKVTGHFAENTAGKIIGIVPALGAGQWRVEIVTQFSGSGSTTLKTPRTLRGAAILTVA